LEAAWTYSLCSSVPRGTPTVDRGSPAVLLIRGGERILIDCGEGTQRQLMRSVGLARIDTILLTHLHGDHYLGLPGLLKTYSLLGREEPLLLFGPLACMSCCGTPSAWWAGRASLPCGRGEPRSGAGDRRLLAADRPDRSWVAGRGLVPGREGASRPLPSGEGCGTRQSLRVRTSVACNAARRSSWRMAARCGLRRSWKDPGGAARSWSPAIPGRPPR